MGANEKLKARYRAVELQREKNVERARRDRANASDAESIRATLHRVGAVDTWERKRFDQAAENIRADAAKRRAGHFRGLQALVEQMRGRGLTLAQIAELVDVDVREIQAELRRTRIEGHGGRGSTASPVARSRPVVIPEGTAVTVDRMSDGVETNERDYSAYDPSRCVRCDAAMLDEDVAPRRGASPALLLGHLSSGCVGGADSRGALRGADSSDRGPESRCASEAICSESRAGWACRADGCCKHSSRRQ